MIKDKYCKRVKRFIEKSKKRICYLRAVKNNEEILYIENNQEYINSVIKKHNPNSTIIYLLLNGMHFDSSFKGNYYYLNIDCYRNDYFGMLYMFRNSMQLLGRCKTLLSDEVFANNIEYRNKVFNDTGKTFKILLHEIENGSKIGIKILEKCLDLYDGLYIWGAVKLGLIITKYMKDNNINILGIIDSKEELRGTKVEGIEVISFDDVIDNKSIFITVLNSKAVNEISNMIKTSRKNLKFATFEDLNADLFMFLLE